jgi:hypothetical protein
MENSNDLLGNLMKQNLERQTLAHILVKIYRLLNDCKPEELEESLRELFKPLLVTAIKEANMDFVYGNQRKILKEGEKVKKYSVEEAFKVDIPTEFD